MRHALVGIDKDQHHVDLVIGDTSRDLLGTAVGKGEEAVNGQTCGCADLHARVSRGTQGVLGQHAAVGVAKLDHQFFSVIMCDQGDIHSSFSFSHFFIKG